MSVLSIGTKARRTHLLLLHRGHQPLQERLEGGQGHRCANHEGAVRVVSQLAQLRHVRARDHHGEARALKLGLDTNLAVANDDAGKGERVLERQQVRQLHRA